MKKTITLLSIGLFTLLNNSKAQTSPNDECSGAITLTIASSSLTCTSYTVDTYFATQSSESATCVSSSQDDDLWYKFVANGYDAVFSVSNSYNDNGSSTAWKAGFIIYSGSCSSLNELSCNSNVANSGDKHTVTGLTPGTTYYVRTFMAGGPNTGYYTLCLYTNSLAPTGPANDNCSGAINVTALLSESSCTSLATSGTVYNATASGNATGSGCFGTPDDDVWYKFDPFVANTTIKLDQSNFDGVIEAYSGTCGSLTYIQCKDQTGSGSIAEKLQLTGLNTTSTFYYLRIFSFTGTQISNSTNAAFSLCVYDTPLGIESEEFKDVNMFPNPAASYVTLENLPNIKNMSISVKNLTGQTFIEQNINDVSATINIEGLAKGIYFVQLKSDNGYAIKRLVVN